MEIPTSSMAKRPCPFSSNENPSKQIEMDYLLESFLSMAAEDGHDGNSHSLQLSLDCAFDRILASTDDQSHLIDRAISLGSLILQSANRSARKRASVHNSFSWPLPPELTIKVFSMLDTQSLCFAAAACSMFNRCAMDPLCYSDIDLTTVVPKVNNAVVSTMIQRAGKTLQSLKLGIVPSPTTSSPSCQSLVHVIRKATHVSNVSWNDKRTRKGKESSILTRSCLNPLSRENGATGTLLRRLHLYNIELLDNTSVCVALSTCPYLLDLEIVGLHVELKQVLESVSTNCHLIERLFIESSKTGRDDSLKSTACIDLVNNCRNLHSLALRGLKLHDFKVRILVKGLRKLKYIDFSMSYSITGQFIRNLGNSNGGNLLEVLLLRDCMHLKELEVARFLTAILAGDYQYIQHIDISNKEGLASEGDWYRRCYCPNLPLKQVTEERPGICLLADFPSELADFRTGIHCLGLEELMDGEMELLSELSNQPSDTLVFSSSSESSYSSDQGSGNEGSQDSGLLISEESSEEVEFLFG